MVGLVETMLKRRRRLTAYGPDEDVIRIVKNLPKAKTPHETETIRRQVAATDAAIDRLVYELYGLSEDEIRIVEDAGGRAHPETDAAGV